MGRQARRSPGDQDLVIELEPDEGSAPGPDAALAAGSLRSDLTVEIAPSALTAATGRAVQAVKELVEAGDGGELGRAPMSELTRDRASVLMTHYLLGPPDELARRVAVFWGDRNGRARSLWGTVCLRPATLDHPVVQGWRGHVRLRTSLVPIPVDLEVERWRSIGLMITLRPTHTHGRIGAHRRWAWFSTGHGVLEQVRVAVERGERPG